MVQVRRTASLNQKRTTYLNCAGIPVCLTVFTFGGPNGFQRFGGAQPAQRGRNNQRQETPPPSWVQAIPLILLAALAIFSWLPGLLSTPDPGYQWTQTSPWTQHRQTSSIHVDYYVNPREWQKHPIYESLPSEKRDLAQASTWSSRLRRFENGIEQNWVSHLRQRVSLVGRVSRVNPANIPRTTIV